MKKLNQFMSFDWNAFAKDKRFLCTGGGEWVDYATLMAQAGASALELNIFLQPTDIHSSSQELERRYAEIAGKVASAVRVPVSVKLSMRFTNLFAVADSLEARGVKGVVLFNRFFEEFAKSGSLPPGLAVWLPNIIYLGIALYLYRKAPK